MGIAPRTSLAILTREQGFEPQLADSESAVLPLDDSRMVSAAGYFTSDGQVSQGSSPLRRPPIAACPALSTPAYGFAEASTRLLPEGSGATPPSHPEGCAGISPDIWLRWNYLAGRIRTYDSSDPNGVL
jgi:hypothetical protein